MYKIALIGAGQLGSRHLQALAKIELDVFIEVVEPSAQAAKTAKQRFNETTENKRIKDISFFSKVDELSDDLDFVIVATSSNVRFRIVKELLIKKKVRYLLLEKVLFQEIEHYYQVEKLLSETHTKCWVNHPRRMYPFYQDLKLKLAGSDFINLTVEGGNWGLACNALHYVDTFSFLTEKDNVGFNSDNLFKHVFHSKRVGFIEFNGQLTGKIGQNFFSLLSLETTAPTIITIASEKLMACIDEGNGMARISTEKNNWEWENINSKIIYFQSELTNIVAENVLVQNKCNLSTYKDAMQLHVPYIQTLLDFMKKIDGKKHKVCPIT